MRYRRMCEVRVVCAGVILRGGGGDGWAAGRQRCMFIKTEIGFVNWCYGVAGPFMLSCPNMSTSLLAPANNHNTPNRLSSVLLNSTVCSTSSGQPLALSRAAPVRANP
jgi:hypothetical protein